MIWLLSYGVRFKLVLGLRELLDECRVKFGCTVWDLGVRFFSASFPLLL